MTSDETSKAAYTGPTGFTLSEGRMHIDGYPNAAKVVKLVAPKAARLAGLRRHQSALTSCEAAMQEIGKVQSTAPAAVASTIIGIAAGYFSCFAQDVSASLNADRVFNGMPDAKECFKYWKAIRDRHYVHDRSALSIDASGLVLDAKGNVLDIVSLRVESSQIDTKHLQLL